MYRVSDNMCTVPSAMRTQKKRKKKKKKRLPEAKDTAKGMLDRSARFEKKVI